MSAPAAPQFGEDQFGEHKFGESDDTTATPPVTPTVTAGTTRIFKSK